MRYNLCKFDILGRGKVRGFIIKTQGRILQGPRISKVKLFRGILTISFQDKLSLKVLMNWKFWPNGSTLLNVKKLWLILWTPRTLWYVFSKFWEVEICIKKPFLLKLTQHTVERCPVHPLRWDKNTAMWMWITIYRDCWCYFYFCCFPPL